MCIVQTNCLAQESIKVKSFKIEINNEDFTKIGYKSYAEDQSQGPISIYLANRSVYLVDNFYGNVKEININNGEITNFSVKLSNKRNPWPRDITYFNDKFYISSDLDSIYILNKELKLEGRIPILFNSPKYFSHITKDSIGIYIENESELLYLKKDNLISNHKTKIEFSPFLEAHGKKYSIYKSSNNQDFIKTKFFNYKLKNSFPDIFTKFNAINIDFNEKTLVYYDVNENIFELYVYMK